MQLLKTSVLACAAALAGCGALTRTPYEAPQVALPAQFEHAQPGHAQPEHAQPAMAQPLADTWWHGFGDPRLDAWIALALERNPDLATAGIRVRRAALQAQLAGRALLPQPSGTLSTGASRPLSGMSGSPRSTLETSSATLGVAWELDLFDRLGAQRDAARFEAQASAQDLQAVRLTLTTTAAGLYWQLAQANERLDSTGQSLAYARRTLELVQAQYRSGAVSRLELREAQQSLAQQEALQSQYLQARAELRQSLAELLAGAPPPSDEPQALPTQALPAVQAGLPAELLGRRPDLRAAELRLHAALASSDAAAARYYPTLSLTGSLGGSSNALLDLLANPVAALGASMTLPFLNLGEMRLNTAIARNQYEEAVVNFRKSLYAALSETEKALSARTRLQQQEGAQLRALQQALEITRLYEARYRAGQVPLRAWLDAQERQRSAQLALSALHLEQLQNQLTLYKVLGGGLAAPG